MGAQQPSDPGSQAQLGLGNQPAVLTPNRSQVYCPKHWDPILLIMALAVPLLSFIQIIRRDLTSSSTVGGELNN